MLNVVYDCEAIASPATKTQCELFWSKWSKSCEMHHAIDGGAGLHHDLTCEAIGVCVREQLLGACHIQTPKQPRLLDGNG